MSHTPVRSLLLLAAAPLLGPAQAPAQAAPPGTDIWIVELRREAPGPSLGAVRRATDRPGYDNQPFFLPGGGAFLYTSIDGTGQADTYRYDLRTGRAERLTRTTPESEYSPTPVPGGDRFSVVRVEADSTQRLWSFALDGLDPRLLLPGVAPVGYHAWVDASTVVLFVLGDPPTLRVADLRSGEARIVARNVGRSLHRVPGTERISFLQRREEGTGWITELDPRTGATRPLVALPGENGFYAWTPEGEVVYGSGSRLLLLPPGAEEGWRLLGDLSGAGIRGISRVAVDPGGRWVAVVAVRVDNGRPAP